MITTNSTKHELISALEDSIAQLQELMSSLDANNINTVPYQGSWTAGQLFRHVERSISGMAKAMETPAKPAERDPGEKIAFLKAAFLDFSTKMKSPDFIIPEPGPYNQASAKEALDLAFRDLRYSADKAGMNDIVEGLPFGDVTKLEMLHFVLYHTQRHLNQMQQITAALKN